MRLNPADHELDLYHRVDEVLHYVWDPIGVANSPSARDEYHMYLPTVLSMLREGADVPKLAAHLDNIATTRMGIGSDAEHATRVARLLVALYQNSKTVKRKDNIEFKCLNSEATIDRFMANTHNLHDSCITSVNFRDSRLVFPNGSMNCDGSGGALTINLDSQFEGRRAKFQLMFSNVSQFFFDHDSAYDGIILSCKITLDEQSIRFVGNEWMDVARPLVVAKEMKYAILL
jgi:hypothetical protein